MDKPVRRLEAVGRPQPIENIKSSFVDAFTVPVGQLLGGLPEVDFLVPGAIPKANVVLVTGESGAAKTWVTYDLMHAVASGGKWMNRGAALGDPQPVLLFNYDNPTKTLSARLIKLGFKESMPVRVHTVGFTKPDLIRKDLPEMLTVPTSRRYLKHIIESFKPSLIVVDSFRQFHELDENDSKEMKFVMAILKEWTSINDCTVVAIHHTSKSGGGKWEAQARGSGEIISAVGVVIEVHKNEAKNGGASGTMRWSKHQAWDVGQTRECTFEVVDEDDREGPLTIVRATSPLPGEIEANNENKVFSTIAANGRPMTREQLYTATHLAKNIVNRTLNRLLNRGRLIYRHKPNRTYAIA